MQYGKVVEMLIKTCMCSSKGLLVELVSKQGFSTPFSCTKIKVF